MIPALAKADARLKRTDLEGFGPLARPDILFE